MKTRAFLKHFVYGCRWKALGDIRKESKFAKYLRKKPEQKLYCRTPLQAPKN